MCFVEVRLRFFLHTVHPILHTRIFFAVQIVAASNRLRHFTDTEKIGDGDSISREVRRTSEPDVLQVSGGFEPFLVPFSQGAFVDRFAEHARNDDLGLEEHRTRQSKIQVLPIHVFIHSSSFFQIFWIPIVFLMLISQIGQDSRARRARSLSDSLRRLSKVPLGENESRIIDHGHFLQWIDLRVVIGHMFEFSQGDFFRLKRNAGALQEDVQRPTRLRHQIVVVGQRRHLQMSKDTNIKSKRTRFD